MKRFTNQHEWGVVASACLGTHGLEIAYCPLCRKYEAYGSGIGEQFVLEHGGTKQGNHIRVPAKLAKEIILQCTCEEFKGCHPPPKPAKFCACPDSCDSLYGGKCIMRIDGKYNGGFRLLYEQTKLSKRYIRREDCPLKNTECKEEK